MHGTYISDVVDEVVYEVSNFGGTASQHDILRFVDNNRHLHVASFKVVYVQSHYLLVIHPVSTVSATFTSRQGFVA